MLRTAIIALIVLAASIAVAGHQARADAAHNLEVMELIGHHHLHMETPDPVADAINGFFSETDV